MTPMEQRLESVQERFVYSRYAIAAQSVEAALCCSVEYDTDFLKVIPDEIIERDYGCGDPTPYVRPGETVVDLGSGGGKACYILAQIVGAAGKVIGVAWNDQMLALARRHRETVAEGLGFAHIQFLCGLFPGLTLVLESSGW